MHSTCFTQRSGWSPRTARFASACPAHITVVVDQEGLLLTPCGVDPPADREAGDTRQTVFIGELLMIDSLFRRNHDQESDVSADEPQAGREGGWQFVHGHRVDCRGGALEEHGGQLVDQANVN